MKKENALMKLGRAVSEYLKGKPAAERAKGRNQSAHNPKQSKPSHMRHEHYGEEQKAQVLNGARSQVINADGTIITVDVFSSKLGQVKRSYRKRERR